MSYSIEEITKTLKAARQSKRLSQRELSDKVGLTQSHISRIENAAVDLQVSNLIELARALELELVLVPKKVLPPVQSLVREAANRKTMAMAGSTAEARAARLLSETRLEPAYQLTTDDEDG
jgi:transcriptional regulator with XRE-family HTH domain